MSAAYTLSLKESIPQGAAFTFDCLPVKLDEDKDGDSKRYLNMLSYKVPGSSQRVVLFSHMGPQVPKAAWVNRVDNDTTTWKVSVHMHGGGVDQNYRLDTVAAKLETAANVVTAVAEAMQDLYKPAAVGKEQKGQGQGVSRLPTAPPSQTTTTNGCMGCGVGPGTAGAAEKVTAVQKTRAEWETPNYA